MAKGTRKVWAVVSSYGAIPDSVTIKATKDEAETTARSGGAYVDDPAFEASGDSDRAETRVFEVIAPARAAKKAWATVVQEGGIPDGVGLWPAKAAAVADARSSGNYEGDADFSPTLRGVESRVFEVSLP
jgi:hypothetical protein